MPAKPRADDGTDDDDGDRQHEQIAGAEALSASITIIAKQKELAQKRPSLG